MSAQHRPDSLRAHFAATLSGRRSVSKFRLLRFAASLGCGHVFDLLLCAWCPTILGEIRDRLADSKTESRGEALKRVMSGELTPAQMKAVIENIDALEAPHEALLAAVAEGRPITSNSDNMDYYNSLQTRYATRYIVCQQADFELARRFNRENPDHRSGYRMRDATRPAKRFQSDVA